MGSGTPAVGALVLPLASLALALVGFPLRVAFAVAFAVALSLSPHALSSLVLRLRVGGGISHQPRRGHIALLSRRLERQHVLRTRAVSGASQVLLAREAAEVHLHDVVRGEVREQVLVVREPRASS